MTDVHDPKDVEERLWKEIPKGRTGMLGTVGSEHAGHFQPMTAFPDPDGGVIWFFTRTETDLARAANGARAMFVIQSKDEELQACIGGRLTQDRRRDVIDRNWNPMVAAWYPDGKDDPALTLLRFDCDDAAVWISDAGPIRMLFEVAKANIAKTMPDLGGRANISL